jgi:hypothetical protein
MGLRSDHKRLLSLAAAAGDIFAAYLWSPEARQIITAADQSSIPLAETLAKIWTSQYKHVEKELIEFALDHRSGQRWLSVLVACDDQLMRNGFLGAIERVFDREMADEAWAYITRPRQTGQLLRTSEGTLSEPPLYLRQAVEVRAYENLFVVLLDKDTPVFSAGWDVMGSGRFFEDREEPKTVMVPIGKGGSLVVDADWSDFFLARGMTST